MMDKLDLILEKLDTMQKDIDSLKAMEEDVKEIRGGVNSLLEWAEECGNVIKFPLPKVK